jgi:transposase InsO family protein
LFIISLTKRHWIANHDQHNILNKKTALKIAGLSANTYHYRLQKLTKKCTDSAFALCFRSHPLQLSFKELNTMKRLLNDERFICWPISSIAHFANLNELLAASISTWYKYTSFFGLRLKKQKVKGFRKKGLVTTEPNQFLHVDTTFWNIEHDVKAAIVFVSDNYSKAILGWNIALQKNAENVKMALQQAIETIHKFHPNQVCATLMADGGKENHNTTITELLLDTTNPDITKIIALKDIAFSNAPIEAINKIMKVYLRHHKPNTLDQLAECIRLAVYDYSCVRPHGSLNGRIPMEVYTNQHVYIETTSYSMEAKIERIEQNRKHNCNVCM